MTVGLAVTRVGVVGGGQMGQGIAQVAAQAGLEVVLVDASRELAEVAIGKLKKTLDRLVEKGKLPGENRDAMSDHLGRARGHLRVVPDHRPRSHAHSLSSVEQNLRGDHA